ncbi:MAG: hypothetical protein N6V41_00990, partial [Candidatus Portiera aleyrodidarum]|nr:hypothetical protein [Candidatus Portiera aleyrodidarum]
CHLKNIASDNKNFASTPFLITNSDHVISLCIIIIVVVVVVVVVVDDVGCNIYIYKSYMPNSLNI